MLKTKVVVAGVTGRMGHALLECIFADDTLQLHGAIDRIDSPQIGRDAPRVDKRCYLARAATRPDWRRP